MSVAIRDDLTYRHFGYLIVNKFIGLRTSRPNSASMWLCQCICGSEVTLSANSLINDARISCGCVRKQHVAEAVRKALWKGEGKISGSWFGCVVKDARRRNIPFKITLSYVAELLKEQKGICAITGLAIDTDSNGLRGTASLDRIDNSEGYVINNVWWVHKDINKMKNIHTIEYFIELCNAVSDFQRRKR